MHAPCAIQCVGANVSTCRDQHTEVKGRRIAEAMIESLLKSAETSFFCQELSSALSWENSRYHRLTDEIKKGAEKTFAQMSGVMLL